MLAAVLALAASSTGLAQTAVPDICFAQGDNTADQGADVAGDALGQLSESVAAVPYRSYCDMQTGYFAEQSGDRESVADDLTDDVDADAAADGSSPAPADCPPTNPERRCETCCHGRLIDWSKYPATIRPMPRPGDFPIPPPPGPGYYSLWDQVMGNCRKAPPKSGYAPFCINAWPFFDADWRFVESIPPCERTCVEKLKRIHVNDCLLYSTGGEYWIRYMDEDNSRLTTTHNTYNLQHVRLFGDLWYSDCLRLYGEYIWADSFGEELPPGPPDVDRGDIQDLFVDVKLMEYEGKPVYVRGGRQELLYGSQRLVSPLPWANRRHTFDGVKVFRQGEKWDIDGFWTQYVPPLASEFDEADANRQLAGTWLTYRPKKGEYVDYYYLMNENGDSVVQQDIVRSPFQTHTFGSRWSGDNCGRLWDFEGALQCGNQGGSDVFAGMATAGVGHNWKNAPLSPTVWMYYDYASGDGNPNAGDVHTFNPPYPFGHYYLGWMDLVGRQNIHDANAHLFLYPQPWITVWLQYHHFWLAEDRDALYNAGGVAYRRDPTGQAGNDVGDEFDFVVNFHLTTYSDLLVSYNKLFGGSFLEATSGPGLASDADSLYLMFVQRW
jgi:Alginate export